jgi:hypothetical protein
MTRRGVFLNVVTSLNLFVMLAIGLVIGLVILHFVMDAVYTAGVKKGVSAEEIIYPAYKTHVEGQKDVDKLAKIGNYFLTKKEFYYAALNLKQASDLDLNYRDAAYGWAYAVMQTQGDHPTADRLTEVQTALSRAEKVDPYYEPMLRLKVLVAQLQNNQDMVQKTQARMKALGIKE